MRDEYDFSDAKRGPVLSAKGKTWINAALREAIFKEEGSCSSES